jgi:hypothetical protein
MRPRRNPSRIGVRDASAKRSSRAKGAAPELAGAAYRPSAAAQAKSLFGSLPAFALSTTTLTEVAATKYRLVVDVPGKIC